MLTLKKIIFCDVGQKNQIYFVWPAIEGHFEGTMGAPYFLGTILGVANNNNDIKYCCK